MPDGPDTDESCLWFSSLMVKYSAVYRKNVGSIPMWGTKARAGLSQGTVFDIFGFLSVLRYIKMSGDRAS